MRKIVSVIVILIGVCLLAGCEGGREADYFGYREKDFWAEVRGERDGVAFDATVRVHRLADGTREVQVVYLAPEAAKGMTVSGLMKADCGLESLHVSLQGMAVPVEQAEIEGLLAPLTSLMRGEEISTVQKIGTRYRLTFSDGGEMVLAEREGGLFPERFSSEELYFTVVWVEG